MAFLARPSDFHGAAPYPAPRHGFWRRMFDAVADSRRRDAERAVTEYVARRGKLTDSMEREIADRLMNNRF